MCWTPWREQTCWAVATFPTRESSDRMHRKPSGAPCAGRPASQLAHPEFCPRPLRNPPPLPAPLPPPDVIARFPWDRPSALSPESTDRHARQALWLLPPRSLWALPASPPACPPQFPTAASLRWLQSTLDLTKLSTVNYPPTILPICLYRMTWSTHRATPAALLPLRSLPQSPHPPHGPTP